MHEWHEAAGAVFEPVGQWHRPWWYPRAGEDKHAAVARECRAVREAVGLLDASTLGKIEIRGPDAATLLDMVYTNAFSSLRVGRVRYGLMCGDDGMVFDDGTTARLGEHHWLMTTTTGNAAHVLEWLEEWLQTEWPNSGCTAPRSPSSGRPWPSPDLAPGTCSPPSRRRWCSTASPSPS